jgi:hypothetical protein
VATTLGFGSSRELRELTQRTIATSPKLRTKLAQPRLLYRGPGDLRAIPWDSSMSTPIESTILSCGLNVNGPSYFQ